MRKWLLEIRTVRQITQKEVALEVEIARSYYSQIESGDRRPSVNVAKKIANYLKFDWTYFFKDDGGELQPDDTLNKEENN